MNSFSWLVYAASVADSVKTMIGMSSFTMFAYGAIANIRAAVHNDMSFEDGPPLPYTGKPFIIAFVLALLSAPIPSKNTLYMIAASEIGEKAAKTEIAADVLDIVKKEIKRMKDGK